MEKTNSTIKTCSNIVYCRKLQKMSKMIRNKKLYLFPTTLNSPLYQQRSLLYEISDCTIVFRRSPAFCIFYTLHIPHVHILVRPPSSTSILELEEGGRLVLCPAYDLGLEFLSGEGELPVSLLLHASSELESLQLAVLLR